MNVPRILATQLLIDNRHVSISERARTLLVTSNDDYMLACPNIRLMFRDNGKTFDCHAECDDNSDNSLRRIERLEQRGWFTGAMAEIRRK